MKKVEFIMAAIVTAVLRFAQIGKADYWYDEGFTVSISRLPLLRMLEATSGDVHPPAYYLVTWLTARISDAEWVMRTPSALFSLLVLWLTWKLVQRLELSRFAQVAVVGWTVISPLQMHYAQETRMYAMLTAEVLGLTLLLLDRRWIWFGTLATLTLYTHNYGLFYLPSLGLVAILRDWGSWKRILYWLPAFLLPLVLWLPWLFVLLGQMSTIGGAYWIQLPTLGSVLFVLYQLMFAYSMPQTMQGLAAMVTAGLLTYTAWRVWRNRPGHWSMLVILAAAPALFALVASYLWRPVFLFRGLIGCSIPLVILIVQALDQITLPYKKAYASFMLGFTLLVGLTGHYVYNAPNKGNPAQWVGVIEDNWQPGDVILSLNDNGIVAVETYAPARPYYKVPPCGQEALGSLSPSTRDAMGVVEKDITEIEAERIWYISTVAPVSSACEIKETKAIIEDHNARLVRKLADNEYNEAGVYLIDG